MNGQKHSTELKALRYSSRLRIITGSKFDHDPNDTPSYRRVRCTDHHPSVILMDISMPIMNGHDATRAIRKIEAQRRKHPEPTPVAAGIPGVGMTSMTTIPAFPNASRVKIFALTGLATTDDKREAFTSGVDGYLVKPVSLASLDQIFKRIGFA